MRDWVPSYGYTTCSPQEWRFSFINQTMPFQGSHRTNTVVAGPSEGFEDEAAQKFFVKRIVGHAFAYSPDPSLNTFIPTLFRIMPLPFDPVNGAPMAPWDGSAGATPDEDDCADWRFWYERRWLAEALLESNIVSDEGAWMQFIDTIHPWWYTVDIKPRQVIGGEHDLWPAACVFNHAAVPGDDVRVVWMLRMLLESRG